MLFDSLIGIPEIEERAGTLSVLNVGAGDLKFSFDKSKPHEVARAKKTIADMLKRGYTLLVEVGGVLHKAKGFDPDKEEYIILDPGDDEPEVAETPAIEEPAPKRKPGRPKGKLKGVPAATTRAHALAPTGGG